MVLIFHNGACDMDKYAIYWDSICEIYFLTKHYLLLGEELSEEFDTVIQPVKEHRDAFDHIARVYGLKFLQDNIPDEEAYRISNMKKAVGHAYRAFFDTADFLTYVCRKKIRNLLNNRDYDEIVKQYPDYPNVKQMLINVPFEIAEIRKNKDVSVDDRALINEVEEYRKIIDKLLSAYKAVYKIFG